MFLVLDAGNTNLTLGVVEDRAIVATRRTRTRAAATADELELALDGLLRLDGTSLADADSIVCASVVPPISLAVQSLAARRGLALLEAGLGSVPLAVRVERPAEVGADRLVNGFAARELYGAPAIVVDFGTATTFDVVAADGAYVGGAIAPGLELGIEALAARTAKLPRVALTQPASVIGRDTVSAMQAGAVVGYQALVAGLLAATRAELAAEDGLADPAAIPAILTGGLSAAAWARGIGGVDAIDPDLTLKGLALLHTRARDRQATPAGALAAEQGA
ncbi:MAG TPA: type III pantothenate kinase [Candidatus Limnocylindrales bacterium]